MSPVVLIVLQAVVNSAVPNDFDLARVAARKRRPAAAMPCGAVPGEIVVCGRRGPDRYRHIPPEGRPEWVENGPPRAEMGLGNGATGALELEQVGNPDGTVSKRIMVRVKTKF